MGLILKLENLKNTMKNLIKITLVFLVLSIVSIGASVAQSTTPRFGTTKNQDNTGKVVTYKFVSTADATGADTVKLVPSAFHTVIIPSSTIKDSLSYSLSSLASSYAGDEIQFSFTNSSGSGHKIKFVGSGWQCSSSGTSITLTTAKRATIKFVFDGAAWVETGRVVQ
jgi:hypothetical protein